MPEQSLPPPPSVITTDQDGWHYNPPRWCAGVWAGPNREHLEEPKACEVHMMPWGHLDHLPPGKRKQ